MAGIQRSMLFDLQREYGAKFSPHQLWQLAEQFPGGKSGELKQLSEHCGVVDRSYCGLFRCCGKAAAELPGLCGNWPETPLTPPQVTEVIANFPAESPSLFHLLAMDAADHLLAGQRAAGKTAWQELVDLHEVLCHLAVCGKRAEAVLTGPFAVRVEDLPAPGTWRKITLAEVNTVCFRPPTSPIVEYHLLFDADYAEGMWEEFCDTPEVKPIGFAAYEETALPRCSLIPDCRPDR